MKKILLSLILLVSAMAMSADGKFTLRAVNDMNAAQVQSRAMSINGTASPKVLTMTIHTVDGIMGEAMEDRIIQMGGKICVSVGNCCVASLPADQWQTVAEWPEVKAIDGLSRGWGIFLDNAHAYTHADEVKDETKALAEGLNAAYDGEGTLMALLDVGIDFSNPAFMDENGKTRIVYAAQLSYDDAGGIDVKEFTTEQIEAGIGEKDVFRMFSHGTHTS